MVWIVVQALAKKTKTYIVVGTVILTYYSATNNNIKILVLFAVICLAWRGSISDLNVWQLFCKSVMYHSQLLGILLDNCNEISDQC
jgi:hypothetical protein